MPAGHLAFVFRVTPARSLPHAQVRNGLAESDPRFGTKGREPRQAQRPVRSLWEILRTSSDCATSLTPHFQLDTANPGNLDVTTPVSGSLSVSVSATAWDLDPSKWLEAVGVPSDPQMRAARVRDLLGAEPYRSGRAAAEVIRCLDDYPEFLSEARRVGTQWAAVPAAALCGAGAGILIAVVGTGGASPMDALGGGDWFAIIVTMAVWVLLGWLGWPTARRDAPGEEAQRAGRNITLAASAVTLLVLLDRFGIDTELVAVGIFIGVMTSPALLLGLLFASLVFPALPRRHLRARHRREHATALLVGLLSRAEGGPPLRGRREWQDEMVWGIEELARTVRSSGNDLPALRDANTIRWMSIEVARQAEAIRKWKQPVLYPRHTRPQLPVFEMRAALTSVALGNWGDLASPADAIPPLGAREYLGAAASTLLGALTYYYSTKLGAAISATWDVADQVEFLFKVASPALGIFLAVVTAPAAFVRAFLEVLGTAKAIREWGGK